MSEITKQELDNFRESVENQEESIFSFQAIFALLVLNWQYFLLSLFIFICGALIYVRYTTPVYQMSAKILIKDDDSRYRRSNNMLANMQQFGIMSNSAGIENEVEVLQSRLLAREAVVDLKLYTDYYSYGRVVKTLAYHRRCKPGRDGQDTAG